MPVKMLKRSVLRTVFLLVLVFAAPVMPVFAAGSGGGALVDAAWAVAQIGRDNIRFLDIRAGGGADYAEGHIPSAVFSDYFNAGWRVRGAHGAPGMLPPVADLEKLVGDLGISNVSHVVIVARGLSAVEMASAARIYWTFKVLGHDAVSILDGGMTAYRALAGAPVQSGAARAKRAEFKAAFRPALVASKEDVINAQKLGEALLDLRPESQYFGQTGPRFMQDKGTIAGAQNLPLTHLTQGGAFKTSAALVALFAEMNLAAVGSITCFCNTGHMASLGWFVAHELLGNSEACLYDGSMAEWSTDPDLGVVKGSAED